MISKKLDTFEFLGLALCQKRNFFYKMSEGQFRRSAFQLQHNRNCPLPRIHPGISPKKYFPNESCYIWIRVIQFPEY